MPTHGRRLRSDPPQKGRPRAMRWFLSLAVIFVAANVYISNYVLQLSRFTIALPRLPQSFDGFKVVMLSDWHRARFGKDNRDLVDMVRAENPDLIALTGDFVEYPSDMPSMEILCRGLSAIAPTYYVTGNHEWAGRMVPQVRECVSACGVVFLDNAYETLTRQGQSICLVGIADLNGPRDQPTLAEVTDRARQGEDPFVLMLCHRYDRFDSFVEQGVDLALAGHAHGGMIRLPLTDGLYGPGRVFFPQRTSGVNWEGRTAMVSSRGLGGVKNLPVRLFNRPEVVSITLKARK